MVSKDINLRYYGPRSDITGPSAIKWTIKDNQTVEELIFGLLDDLGVGPVYRHLFGLRVIEKEIWLAPNLILADELRDIKSMAVDKIDEDQFTYKESGGFKLIKQVTKKVSPLSHPPDGQLTFQIQLKFKPAAIPPIRDLDHVALDMIWSELRYLALNKKYINESSQTFLADPKLLELIVLDVTRHVIDNNIGIDKIHTAVKFKEFIPKYNSWVKKLEFSHDDLTLLLRSIKFALDSSSTMGEARSRNLKAMYIEKFLDEVCPEHGIEFYRANEITRSDVDRIVTVRIYLDIRKSRFCKVDKVPFQVGPKGFSGSWEPVCSLDTLLSAYCTGANVFIDRPDLPSISLEFHHHLNALSFLSIIHGYARLSIRWNVNMTKSIYSPHSQNLKLYQIHGPIDMRLVERKLANRRRGGTYLVRQCNLKTNYYYIDILVERGSYCTIGIKHDKKLGKLVNEKHEFWPKRNDIELIMKEDSYDDMDHVLNDINIKLARGTNVQALIRIRPGENDDCLNLLLCLDAKTMQSKMNPGDKVAPLMISPNEISLTRGQLKMSGNRLCVKTGILSCDRRQIIFKFAETLLLQNERAYRIYNSTNQRLDSDALDKRKKRVAQEAVLIASTFQSDYIGSSYFVQLEQNRIMDWAYLKNRFLAETIGIELSRCALIQEGFSNQVRLDNYLKSLNNELPAKVTELAPIQLAEAMEYMELARVVHGKIRCHNIYVRKFEPFMICVTDPLGTIDFHEDRAFIPSEINLAYQFNEAMKAKTNGSQETTINEILSQEPQQIHVSRLSPGFDVWAIATTIWQIFNWAKRPPPGQYAYHLQKPRLCSNRLWCCLQECWHANPNSRPSAVTLARHLRTIVVEAKNPYLRGPRLYESVSYETSNNSCPYYGKMGYTQLDDLNSSNSGSFSGATATTGLNDKNDTNGSLSSASDDIYDYNINNGIGQEIDNLKENSDTKSIDYIIDANKLVLQAEIGRGSCGVVRRAKLRRPNQQSLLVAVKYVLNPSSDYYAEELADLRKEYAILRGLNHENIVRIYGITGDDHVKLVFEYLPLGCLLNFIRNSVNSYTKLPLNKYARDIANGLCYLESKDIVHRDLALRNVLMKNSIDVKICDFGLAKRLKPGEEYTIKNLQKGLPWKWCAPETYTRWIFTHKTDVWSFGVVLWELHTGGQNPQYPGKINMLPDLFEKGLRLQKPETCPDNIYDLMQQCWAYEPDDRPSFKTICEDISIHEDYLPYEA